jgi:hypothetical protein
MKRRAFIWLARRRGNVAARGARAAAKQRFPSIEAAFKWKMVADSIRHCS